ncbi:hypothetical protein ACLB2K_039282 [Fragaria x ananassa]
MGYVLRVRLASFFGGAAVASFMGLYILHNDYKVAHEAISHQYDMFEDSLGFRNCSPQFSFTLFDRRANSVASFDRDYREHPPESANLAQLQLDSVLKRCSVLVRCYFKELEVLKKRKKWWKATEKKKEQVAVYGNELCFEQTLMKSNIGIAVNPKSRLLSVAPQFGIACVPLYCLLNKLKLVKSSEQEEGVQSIWRADSGVFYTVTNREELYLCSV